jgi:molybdopterin-guanine dinucleotide biosynthesis protein A
MTSLFLPQLCTGLVLAGGAGQRMGGQDKGLLPWRGATLAGHAAARLGTQGLAVWVSTNRHPDEYARLGLPLLADRRSDYPGLAVPCDTPFFPDDLAVRLWSAVHVAGDPRTPTARAAYVRCGARSHPVFCLVSRALADPLTRFLDDGGRRVLDWWQAVGALAVDLGTAAEPAFANANTPEELQRLRDSDSGPVDTACSS